MVKDPLARRTYAAAAWIDEASGGGKVVVGMPVMGSHPGARRSRLEVRVKRARRPRDTPEATTPWPNCLARGKISAPGLAEARNRPRPSWEASSIVLGDEPVFFRTRHGRTRMVCLTTPACTAQARVRSMGGWHPTASQRRLAWRVVGILIIVLLPIEIVYPVLLFALDPELLALLFALLLVSVRENPILLSVQGTFRYLRTLRTRP